RPERDRALEVEVAPVAEHHRERDRREQVDEREVEAVEEDRLHVRFAVALGDLAELAHVRFLTGEGLDDPHPRDVLGQGRSAGRTVIPALAWASVPAPSGSRSRTAA